MPVLETDKTDSSKSIFPGCEACNGSTIPKRIQVQYDEEWS